MAEIPRSAVPYPTGFMPGQAPAPDAPTPEVSVFGVMLLSAVSVAMAVLGMLMLGLVVMGVYWLVSHIPVPAFVWRILTHLGVI